MLSGSHLLLMLLQSGGGSSTGQLQPAPRESSRQSCISSCFISLDLKKFTNVIMWLKCSKCEVLEKISPLVHGGLLRAGKGFGLFLSSILSFYRRGTGVPESQVIGLGSPIWLRTEPYYSSNFSLSRPGLLPHIYLVNSHLGGICCGPGASVAAGCKSQKTDLPAS